MKGYTDTKRQTNDKGVREIERRGDGEIKKDREKEMERERERERENREREKGEKEKEEKEREIERERERNRGGGGRSEIGKTELERKYIVNGGYHPINIKQINDW